MTDETKSAPLSDHERIDLLQSVVFQLSQHAAYLDGAVNVVSHLLTATILRRATEDADPYQWIQNYVTATAEGCRQIRPKCTDATTLAHVNRGIEIATNDFLEGLLKLSGDLDGAPKGPRANT
jgi:hypothetical protein